MFLNSACSLPEVIFPLMCSLNITSQKYISVAALDDIAAHEGHTVVTFLFGNFMIVKTVVSFVVHN